MIEIVVVNVYYGLRHSHRCFYFFNLKKAKGKSSTWYSAQSRHGYHRGAQVYMARTN